MQRNISLWSVRTLVRLGQKKEISGQLCNHAVIAIPYHSIASREKEFSLDRVHLIPAYQWKRHTPHPFEIKIKSEEMDPRPRTLIFTDPNSMHLFSCRPSCLFVDSGFRNVSASATDNGI